MIYLPSGTSKIFLFNIAVDMRKSFEGLSVLVDEYFPGELLTGALFVFINRRRTHVKILCWEGDGFVLWYKRLEKGTFPNCFNKHVRLERRQLSMLLEGVTPKRLNKRFSLS